MVKPGVAAEPAVSAPGQAAPSNQIPDLALAIEFEQLPNCVDEATLERRVAALVRPDRLNSARRVRGTVAPAGAGWSVQFRVFEGEVLVGRRRLEFESGDCGPFQESVELVLALLLEGQGLEQPTEETAGDAVVAAPTASASAEAKAPVEVLPEAEKRPSPRVTGRFRLGGEASLGVMPAPAAGVRLEGGVELKVPIALFARATWHVDGSMAIPSGGSLELGGYRLAVMGCYLYRHGWVLSFCGGLGFVSLTAAGKDVPGARAATFDQGAGVFGLSLGVPLTRSWSLELGTELEAWFARPEYVLLGPSGAEVVHTSSGVPVSAWLAVGYTF